MPYEWKHTQYHKFLANSLKEEQNESDDDADDYDEENNELKKISKFNFSGLSFKDYVNSIDNDLNTEMASLVTLFIK